VDPLPSRYEDIIKLRKVTFELFLSYFYRSTISVESNHKWL